MYMHENAPSRASRYTTAWLMKLGIKDNKLMLWPPYSPDLSPIENLWLFIKQEVYICGKQYNSKVEQWNAVKYAENNASKDL